MKIYAYTLPTVPEKSGWLKIGETRGDVEVRIKQQSHEFNLKTEIVWQDAVITERSYIDKRFTVILPSFRNCSFIKFAQLLFFA
ncbi:MAG: hypothetical protein LBT46_12145 [Planctomycetaceae bacterium]|jgi:hypothetical protein|nr:hypothetical protein [Planctomycetaceae bacterium]